MQNLACLNTRSSGISEFTDSKNRSHKVKHSVILTDYDKKRELEEVISEELYRIFAGSKKLHL